MVEVRLEGENKTQQDVQEINGEKAYGFEWKECTLAIKGNRGIADDAVGMVLGVWGREQDGQGKANRLRGSCIIYALFNVRKQLNSFRISCELLRLLQLFVYLENRRKDQEPGKRNQMPDYQKRKLIAGDGAEADWGKIH